MPGGTHASADIRQPRHRFVGEHEAQVARGVRPPAGHRRRRHFALDFRVAAVFLQPADQRSQVARDLRQMFPARRVHESGEDQQLALRVDRSPEPLQRQRTEGRRELRPFARDRGQQAFSALADGRKPGASALSLCVELCGVARQRISRWQMGAGAARYSRCARRAQYRHRLLWRGVRCRGRLRGAQRVRASIHRACDGAVVPGVVP